MNLKKTAIAAAVATAVGIPATASAASITMTFSALFSMVTPTGNALLQNTDEPKSGPWYQYRTPVTGTASFNLDTGFGTAVITPFSFLGSGVFSSTGVTFQAIGNGFGGPGNLILGNMGFDWNFTIGAPVSIVFDATGFFGAGSDGYSTSEVITGGNTAWSEGFNFDFGFRSGTYTLPMGASPMVTTDWNTANVGASTLGVNPSGTLPLSADTIGGDPMIAGPFTGFNINFDFTSLHIASFTPDAAVPVPAAVWLFGSGLLGLIGVARRRKHH